MKKAKLIVHTGGMYSGKTTALQQDCERYIRARKKVVMVKPTIDNRYSEDSVVNHIGIEVKCINSKLDKLDFNAEEYDVILIDEIQFFKPSIINDIKRLLKEDKVVIVDGLDMDFKGNAFETTMNLMGIAEEVIKHKAVCEYCGEDAGFSYRISNNKEQILIGQAESYIAVCRGCFYNLENNRVED